MNVIRGERVQDEWQDVISDFFVLALQHQNVQLIQQVHRHLSCHHGYISFKISKIVDIPNVLLFNKMIFKILKFEFGILFDIFFGFYNKKSNRLKSLIYIELNVRNDWQH